MPTSPDHDDIINVAMNLEHRLLDVGNHLRGALRLSIDFPEIKDHVMFLVYAHEERNDYLAEGLHHWAQGIGMQLRSDKSPIMQSDTKEDALKNILTNQFNLLPAELSENRVDKVVLFVSKRIGQYWKDCSSYPEEIARAGRRARETCQVEFPSSTREKVKEAVTEVFTSYEGHHPNFHHVLTEIGLLKLRWDWDNASYDDNIIPVDIDNQLGLQPFAGLFPASQLYVKPKAVSDSSFPDFRRMISANLD